MTDAVTVLREEIATLEGQLSKHRQALTILTGTPTPTKSPVVKSPAAKSPAPRRSTPAGSSLAERIVTHLSANKGELFTAAQVTEALAKTDKSVQRRSVLSRLGELFHRTQLTREDGRYGVA